MDYGKAVILAVVITLLVFMGLNYAYYSNLMKRMNCRIEIDRRSEMVSMYAYGNCTSADIALTLAELV